MTKEEIIDFCEMKSQLEPENEDIFSSIIKTINQESILEKIRAYILEEKECAYADFERYKVEYLGQGCQEVYDSLPHDDFRYGMERALEIIDKYKAESEGK